MRDGPDSYADAADLPDNEKRHEQPGAPVCLKDTKRAADPRQQYAFRQKLAKDAAATCAEGKTHCNLTPASRGASEQKVREIQVAIAATNPAALGFGCFVADNAQRAR